MAIEYQDLVDSIQLDVVLENLGISVSSVVRGEHWASCQLSTHPSSDSKPSFSINEDSLLWNCFTCDEGGSLARLVALTLGLDWEQAVEWLVPYSDVDPTGDNDEDFLKQLDRYLGRLEEKPKRIRSSTLPVFNEHVFDRFPLAPVELLEKWHIYEDETVALFGIRYVEDRKRVKGDNEYSGPALVIPHVFRGQIVGFQERWLDPDKPKWIPKYTNSSDFPKAETLFNWDRALAAAMNFERITVVESSLTVARLWEIGYYSVATFGAQVNPAQVKLLTTLTRGVILARDEDPDYLNSKGATVEGAGIKAYRANADNLSSTIPVWTLPPISQEKGDLADLETHEVDVMYEQMKPVFSIQATDNR